MNKKSCQKCLYIDQCPSSRPCKHYFPIDDDDGEELIERGREQFYCEWKAYMMESQDSDF